MPRPMVEAEFAKLGSYHDLRRPSGTVEIFLDSPSLKVGISSGAEGVDYLEFSHSQSSAYRLEACVSCRSEEYDYQVVYRGLDIFHTLADQLVAALKSDGLEEDEEGTSWVSRRLQLALWREDPSLPFFQSILIGRNGYFS